MTEQSSGVVGQQLEEKDGQPLVWYTRIEQETGIEVFIPAESRGVARAHAEEFTSEHLDDPIQRWVEDWDEGNSEYGERVSGRRCIITRQYLRTEVPELAE